ncbi:hypothetical protein LCGC14_2837680 [marine sediment metagenome]|uniref:AP2/ERF domain-containing protein n=1 Tax=marine sediment metagenome TaxID=412755 RepID=A0A0F8YCD8_9ZZZZ
MNCLREYLAYDAETGRFTWIRSPVNSVKVGSIAGRLDTFGHRLINLHKRQFFAHRLAWYFVYGEWPPTDIDHKNRAPDDNRIDNLRLATQQQNCANATLRTDNKCGYKGVSGVNGKWRARISVNKKALWLGYHDTPESAALAYDNAAIKHFGEFAVLNCAQP